MEALKDLFLNHNWTDALIGLIGGGIISLILAYLFTSRPRLSAQINTLELVGPNAVFPNELEFLFRGKKVPKVSLSLIAIWNDGNVTINGNLIVSSDPLRILVHSGTVLDTKVLRSSREVNGFSCALCSGHADNVIQCKFDYLDVKDGALIQVIHTGDDKVEVVGTLREIPKGVQQISNPYQDKSNKHKLTVRDAKLVSLLLTTLGIACWLGVIAGKVDPPKDWPPFVFIGSMFTIVGIVIYLGVRRMPPDKLSTQMASNETKRPPWLNLIGR
jgi:hypothetical protein